MWKWFKLPEINEELLVKIFPFKSVSLPWWRHGFSIWTATLFHIRGGISQLQKEVLFPLLALHSAAYLLLLTLSSFGLSFSGALLWMLKKMLNFFGTRLCPVCWFFHTHADFNEIFAILQLWARLALILVGPGARLPKLSALCCCCVPMASLLALLAAPWESEKWQPVPAVLC